MTSFKPKPQLMVLQYRVFQRVKYGTAVLNKTVSNNSEWSKIRLAYLPHKKIKKYLIM
jgi:hypothetical protein